MFFRDRKTNPVEFLLSPPPFFTLMLSELSTLRFNPGQVPDELAEYFPEGFARVYEYVWR